MTKRIVEIEIMTINQKQSSTTRIPVNALNTIIEQVSELQEDTGIIKTDISNIETVLTDTKDKVESLENKSDPTYNTVNADTFNGGAFNGSDATIDTVNSQTVNVGNNIKIDAPTGVITAPFGNITELATDYATVNHKLNTKTIDCESAELGELVTTRIVNKGNITSASITTANETVSNRLTTKDFNSTGNVELNNVEINGTITGVSDIELNDVKAESIDTETLDSRKIVMGATVMSDEYHILTPTPLADNNDRYTIELPTFTGTMNLSWKDFVDDEEVTVWQAVVIGADNNYTISWGTFGSEIVVTDLFQYNGKLYVRTSTNGSLYYNYCATKELEGVHLYYNMGGWSKEELLEQLCDERHQYVCKETNGTFTFGSMFAPGFTILGLANFDDLEVNKLKVKESLNVFPKNITWNNTNVKVCDDFNTNWVL